MPVPIPNLDQLQINPPQPATMNLQGLEHQRRREETDLRKDYMRLATDKFTQQIMEQERNFGAGKAEWEFEKTVKAMDFAAKNATSEDEFNETVEKISGTNPKVEWKGPDVELTFQAKDGKKYKMKGKREVVYDAMDAGAKDISWFSDPEKAAQVSEYMRKSGVTVEPAEDKEAAATLKHQRAIEVKKTAPGKAPEKEKPATKAELIAPLLRDFRDGRPIEDFSENEQKLLKPEIEKDAVQHEEEKITRIYEQKLRIKSAFEAERPQDYHESLKNAVDAIMTGADPKEIYYKMIKEYPEQAKELESMLFTPSTEETMKALIELFGNK